MILGLTRLCTVLGILLGLWDATPWVAPTLQDMPALGEGLLRMPGRWRSPHSHFSLGLCAITRLPLRCARPACWSFSGAVHWAYALPGGCVSGTRTPSSARPAMGVAAGRPCRDLQRAGRLGQRGIQLGPNGRRALR